VQDSIYRHELNRSGGVDPPILCAADVSPFEASEVDDLRHGRHKTATNFWNARL
jgi:hypothetical protein